MNKQMKRWLPNAIFIGFTGTPLLKKDAAKLRTQDVYLDNELHDHNLFQAICRTNRLDGEDKDYGRIVDFKKLFEDVQEAISVYSSDELDNP